MTEPRMDPSLAKRFRSGRPCLDFAHTAAAQEWIEPELVYDAASLERWLGHVLGRATVHAEDADVVMAHGLRASVLRLARARAAGGDLPVEDVRTVNACAEEPPPVPRLTPAGTIAPLVLTAR